MRSNFLCGSQERNARNRNLLDNVKKTLLGQDLQVHRTMQATRELQEKKKP